MLLVAASNVALNRAVPRRFEIPAGLCAGGAMLLLAKRVGANATRQGLSGSAAPRGLRVGAAVAAPISAAMLLGAALPVSRHFYENEAVLGGSAGDLAYQWLARIPLATAVTEELVFRSGLEGILVLRRAPVQAALISATLFGAWHVLPTIDRMQANTAALDKRGSMPRERARVLVTAVAATSVASLGLSWLRDRTQSVIAPIIVHAAVNISGMLGVWLAARLSQRAAGLSPHR